MEFRYLIWFEFKKTRSPNLKGRRVHIYKQNTMIITPGETYITKEPLNMNNHINGWSSIVMLGNKYISSHLNVKI